MGKSDHPTAREKQYNVMLVNIKANAEQTRRIETQVTHIVTALASLEDDIKKLVHDYTGAALHELRQDIGILADRLDDR